MPTETSAKPVAMKDVEFKQIKFTKGPTEDSLKTQVIREAQKFTITRTVHCNIAHNVAEQKARKEVNIAIMNKIKEENRQFEQRGNSFLDFYNVKGKRFKALQKLLSDEIMKDAVATGNQEKAKDLLSVVLE